MTSNPTAQPRKKKTDQPSSSPSFSSLPDEIVLSCRRMSHTWRSGPDMAVPRKHAESCLLDDKIYVTGGCTKREDWGEVFDVKTQTWKPLPKPPLGDDDWNHKVAVFEERLYVFAENNDKYAYDSAEGRWVLVVGLQPLTGPWCLIGDVMFAELDGRYKWYNTKNGMWLKVNGLNVVYANRAFSNYSTIQLVNHGGKLVITWERWRGRGRNRTKSIWCAVIRLEERVVGTVWQIWGEVQWCNVVMATDPIPFKLTSCQSVSI